MILTKSNLSQLLSTVKRAAQNAGEYILKESSSQFEVIGKSGGDSLASQVVTKIDIMAQEIILKEILPTCQEFDIALLTEELEDDKSRLIKDYFWAVDPLDGTLPFIEKSDGYAVSIALLTKGGTPVVGVVYHPPTQTIYSAIKGEGVYKNGKPLSPSDNKNTNFSLYFDRSFLLTPNFDKSVKELKGLAQMSNLGSLKISSQMGAVANAISVLESAPACYFKFPKSKRGGGSIWDYAAVTLFFNEIDYFVTDIYGKRLKLNNSTTLFMNDGGIIFATSSDIWQGVKDIWARINGDGGSCGE